MDEVHPMIVAGEDPFGRPAAETRPPVRRRLRQRIASALTAVGAAVAKFFAQIKALVFLLPKAKLLTTSGTALLSIAAYSLFWGWPFAAGFVLLLFIHEMGHVIALRREGIKASAPTFVPFLGAVIAAKSLGRNAVAEARVGLAGPILGTIGAALVLLLAEALNSEMLRALAYVGFMLNLFNLLPVTPLDGGRAMAAMAPWMWFAGLGVLVAMLVLVPNPILLLIVIIGALDTWRRWKARSTRSLEQAAYYRVTPHQRLLVGATYVALIVILAVGMADTHVLSAGGHSFRLL
ncbi:MAG TPA: site-2 protease family protein [Solirubrobacteraceae bacterium]|nr:site-2 protease family protein [Solirubrobacteraceae bacterium]